MTSHYEPSWSASSTFFGGLGNALLAPQSPTLPLSLAGALMMARPRLLDPPINHSDAYLRGILLREAVDTSMTSPLRKVRIMLWPIIWTWANGHLLSVEPSGSFAKGTANASGTDIDLFVSVSPNVVESLGEIYYTLERALQAAGYKTRRQNVSINITVDGQSVDLVPAKRQNLTLDDHSLYRRKADTWTKTNVTAHAWHVLISGRTEEIRIMKLWRDQLDLDWPSFYLELTVIRALRLSAFGDLATNVWKVFEFLRDDFPTAWIEDPANTNNVISNDLTMAEKIRIKEASLRALAAHYWQDIVA